MEFSKLGTGDNENNLQQTAVSEYNEENTKHLPNDSKEDGENFDSQLKELKDDLSSETFDEHENNLKTRITQCRNVIEALKHELNEEKCKVENACLSSQSCSEHGSKYTDSCDRTHSVDGLLENLPFSSNQYSAYVDSKLNCDENLVEYEKQLQKYQDTLNMAQLEKRNAIRKQMLCKAYRLKLLEVENQCNIELLRVKQSLQCLEPLKVIAQNWNSNTCDLIDNNSFNLLPRYPDFYLKCSSDTSSTTAELDANNIMEIPEKSVRNDLKSCDG